MKSDFIVAVHSLIFLHHKGCTSSSDVLAKNVCTNAARVRKIMAKLKQAGIVTTREGHVGGYCACEDVADLDLATVAKALNAVFVESKWHSGSEDLACMISHGMGRIFDDIYADLDAECYCKLKGITIKELESKIFK